MNQLFAGLFEHSTSQACLVDLTPPTFAGISSLTVQVNGSLRAVWPSASDSTPTIRYNIYVQAATATGLFSSSNLVMSTKLLTKDIYQLADGTLLQRNTTYYVGVRAEDAVGNESSTMVSLSALSTGIFDDDLCNVGTILQQLAVDLQNTENDLAQDHTDLASDHTNLAADLDRFEDDLDTFEADVVQVSTNLSNISGAIGDEGLVIQLEDEDTIDTDLEDVETVEINLDECED